MSHEEPAVGCPNCGKPVDYRRRAENPFFPFCCERCKLLDLGEWLSEEHRIEGQGPQDVDEGACEQQGPLPGAHRGLTNRSQGR